MASKFVRSIRQVKDVSKLAEYVTTPNDIVQDLEGNVYIRLEKGFAKISGGVSEDDITPIQSDITNLKSENTKLKNRVTELETKSSELENKSSELETKTSELETKTTELENKSTDFEARIKALETPAE